MSLWSVFGSMNMAILISSLFMHSSLVSLPSMMMVAASPSSNCSVISWLDSTVWDDRIAYWTSFAGSSMSMVAVVVFRSMKPVTPLVLRISASVLLSFVKVSSSFGVVSSTITGVMVSCMLRFFLVVCFSILFDHRFYHD